MNFFSMSSFGGFLSNALNATIAVLMVIIKAAVVFAIGFLLIKLLMSFISKSKAFAKLDSGVQSFLKSLIRIILYVVLFIVVAGVFGIETASLITVLGSAGLAIGLALQGGLSNFAGGVIILIFKPFKIGDFITVAAGTGTVSAISIFYTTIVTPDNKSVTIPNGTLANGDVTNYSVHDTRRVDLDFSVSYSSDISKVKEILISTAKANSMVLSDPAPFVALSKQDSSALVFTLRTWCSGDNYWSVYFDLNEAVKRELDKNGIEIPFQQLDVHVKNK